MQNYYNDFDYSGNYYDGYSETEEERRKREKELADRAVQTQEIKTYGDGTVEETMTREYAPAVQPQAIEPVQAVKPVQEMPVAQPVTQPRPVDPETYNRMIQAESRGKDFDASGQPLTSPKGAMFRAQVMPATAAQPGYGIRPAAAQTPEEYNRVGQEYYQAMLQKYAGDEQAAAAAYNAGPGRVDQNIRANNGVLNVAQLPRETQNYLQQVLPQPALDASGRATAATDSRVAAAQPMTAQPTAPVAPEQLSQYSLATGQTGLGIQTGAAPQAEPAKQYIDSYQSIQDNPMQLLALRGDESAPKFIRERAGEQAYELMNKEVQQKTAEREAQKLATAAASGDRKASNTIARELQSQEGSWLKMILLGFIDPKLAGEEAVKLGYGNKWVSTTDADGKAALVQVNAKGLPLKGYTTDGAEIKSDDLVRFAAGGGKRDLDIVGGTFVNDKTGEVGRMVTDKRTGKTQVQTDTGLKPMTGFRPQSSSGTLEDQRTRTIQDINLKLRGKGVEESMAILRDYNQRLVGQGFPPVQPGEVGINVPQIGGGQAAAPTSTAPAAGPVAPAAGQSAAQAAAAGSGGKITPLPTTAAAPAGVPPAATLPVGQRPTMTQLDTQATIAKETAETIGKDIGVTAANFGKAKDSAMTLINQAQGLVDDPGFEVSVGFSSQPFFQLIPGTDKATWMAKKEEVVGKTFLTAIESLKGFGALSDQEGRAATAAISRLNNTNQNEESYKAAVKELQDIVKRGVDRNAAKLGKPSVFGTEEFTEKTTTQQLSPADKARAELERRRKEKK